jgi:hypothetical protein
VAATTRTWGFTPEEWATFRDALERLLEEVGRQRSTVTYGEIARRVFGGRVSARSGALMDLLGEVDSAADARLGVMVASLVVRADSGIPGDGYFAFAAQQMRRSIPDQRAFWDAEVAAVWDAYARVAECADGGERGPEMARAGADGGERR